MPHTSHTSTSRPLSRFIPNTLRRALRTATSHTPKHQRQQDAASTHSTDSSSPSTPTPADTRQEERWARELAHEEEVEEEKYRPSRTNSLPVANGNADANGGVGRGMGSRIQRRTTVGDEAPRPAAGPWPDEKPGSGRRWKTTTTVPTTRSPSKSKSSSTTNTSNRTTSTTSTTPSLESKPSHMRTSSLTSVGTHPSPYQSRATPKQQQQQQQSPTVKEEDDWRTGAVGRKSCSEGRVGPMAQYDPESTYPEFVTKLSCEDKQGHARCAQNFWTGN